MKFDQLITADNKGSSEENTSIFIGQTFNNG